jgi:hypothetical protein
VERRLSAILAVDVVGTMLMGFNEEGVTGYIDALRKAGLPEA